MKAIKSGTTSYRNIADASELQAGEVAFAGEYTYAADRLTPLMVWDSQIGNVRPMTQPEIDALPAQIQAAKDAASPDYANIRDNATAAFNANTTYLAIASPSNAQVVAQVQRLTQQNQQIIKAVAKLAIAAL